MPVPSSGQIRISDLVAEFGGTAPHALSEYYRNGLLVPSNNTNIPTSGQFRFSNAYGAVNEIAIAATSGTNIDISTLFGSNWTSTVPKRLTIGSGVTIGGTGSSAAIIIPSNMAGTLEIDNAGNIIGFGGAANGGAGGNAISNSASGVTINNTGLLAGGGGGGGLGGTGGNGTFTTTTQTNHSPPSAGEGLAGGWTWRIYTPKVLTIRRNNGSYFYSAVRADGASVTQISNGYRSSYRGSDGYSYAYNWYEQTSTTSSSTGGAGGAGGRGRGYNQTLASGSAGSSGGTNAGTGGSGGSGGDYGAAGSTGSTGANGNATNGSGGASGGAAGAAVTGTSVTMNNTGTLAGAVA